MTARSAQPEADGGEKLGFSVSSAPCEGGGTAVTIFGELDMAAAAKLRDELDRAVDAEGDVELDMRACSFVDSTGIATLVTAGRRLGEEGRVLRIRGARERVSRILELAGLPAQGWVSLEP